MMRREISAFVQRRWLLILLFVLFLFFIDFSFNSQKKTCGICQNSMIKGQGDAIFIAKCSHYFHHNCVTSNARHGNRVCPVYRAKWTTIPFQIRTPNPPENLRANFVSSNTNYQQLQDAQLRTYDDDEDLMEQQSINPEQVSDNISDQIVKITTFPDFPAFPSQLLMATLRFS